MTESVSDVLKRFKEGNVSYEMVVQMYCGSTYSKDRVIETIQAYRKDRYNAYADRAVLWQAVEDALDFVLEELEHE